MPQAPTTNRINQGQHLASKAVDYSASPDATVYATEDGRIDSYKQRGSGTGNAGNVLRLAGKTGMWNFCHLERSLVNVGQNVRQGQPIAIMGYTGYTIPAGPAGRHLHCFVLTPNGYVYPPTLFNKPKEANEVVQNADNYYWRYGVKLAEQIRGRQLSREEFNKFLAGKTDLQAIEILSDDAEADRALHAQRVGQLAIKDDWQGQIYRLIAQVNDLNTRPTKAQLEALQGKLNEMGTSIDLANKKAENALKELKEAQAKQSEDTKLLDEAGSWLTKLFNRLFKKG